jgi:hypothetical protein
MELESPDLTSAVLSDRVILQVPSRTEWIEPAVEYLRQRAVLSGACSESRSTVLLIAMHEALSNAIIHGNLEISSVVKERDDNARAGGFFRRGVADLSRGLAAGWQSAGGGQPVPQSSAGGDLEAAARRG